MSRIVLPEPSPGLVVHYSYLWHREHSRGQDEGRKDCPCAIVAAIKDTGDGPRVVLIPITHSRPERPEDAVELPLKVKLRLGLDEMPSWALLTEWNEFLWPGPDLRPRPGGSSFGYGMLPPRLFETIRLRFLELAKRGRTKRVMRSE